MKIAIISDVHANFPALDAISNELENVDAIIHAGDLIGYNPFPNRTIEIFRRLQIISVAGNHDRGIKSPDMFNFCTSSLEVLKWTAERLTKENETYINQLPIEQQLIIDDYKILVVHGAPNHPNRYIYPTDLTLELIEDVSDEVDMLVWGHTHYPIMTKIEGVILLNPGSVGQPRDGDWRASYAIFNTTNSSIEFQRREYNIQTLVNKARKEDFPQQIINSIPKQI